jgi:hypothetical protein
VLSVSRFHSALRELPHFHARYQGQQAAISILAGEVLEGVIPPAKMNWSKRVWKSTGKT